MITDTEIQNILSNTILDLRQRGIIQDLPSHLSHLPPIQQIYRTHDTLATHQTNQLLHHQLTQGNTSLIPYNSSWGNNHPQQYNMNPASNTNNEIAFLSDSSLDSLQLEDSLEKEVKQRGKEIVTEEFQSQHLVAIDREADVFNCIPIGFETKSSQDNNNNNNNNSIHRSQSVEKIGNEQKISSTVNRFSSQNCTETINTNYDQSEKDISIRTENTNVDLKITTENIKIQEDVRYEDVATDSTSKRRGIKR